MGHPALVAGVPKRTVGTNSQVPDPYLAATWAVLGPFCNNRIASW